MRAMFDPYVAWNDRDDEPTDPFARIPRARVLVAEDDPTMREMVSARLRRDGCDVIEVGSGDEALCVMKVIAEHESSADDLALVIMDVRMPGLSGLEVVYLLRTWRWNTPILLMTAYPDPELLAEGRRLGVPILAKPFRLSRLSEAAAIRARPVAPEAA